MGQPLKNFITKEKLKIFFEKFYFERNSFLKLNLNFLFTETHFKKKKFIFKKPI